jgi:hypothetical protein
MPSKGFFKSSVHLSLSVAVCLLILLNVSKIEKMPGVPVEIFGSVVFLCRTSTLNPITFLHESRFLILSRIIVLERTFRLVCFNYFAFGHEPFFTEHHIRDII